ncbi:hypothetical protein RvY_02384-2 [Ramazzottius varieornatus]|uniref:Secreted protein n=1 Tax=Ramazzottius varieornatus TaxID=947166 RepID=A0A1D1UJK5_RAMVA|nr:hypothetical protein RvY_02384-2 [Ramazzottius varieornatus]
MSRTIWSHFWICFFLSCSLPGRLDFRASGSPQHHRRGPRRSPVALCPAPGRRGGLSSRRGARRCGQRAERRRCGDRRCRCRSSGCCPTTTTSCGATDASGRC